MASIPQFIRRLLDRPGSADIAPFQRLATQAGTHEDRVRALTELPRPSMDDLAEFCAIAREAARRTLGMRPFDVQLVGALALLSGHVAEMATGEGKTLSGAIAAAGHALRGEPVHVISVNDYLARRDAEWMGPLYEALGVSVGHIGQSSTPEERREAYAKDVTYAPVSEIGFDLLRDRIATGRRRCDRPQALRGADRRGRLRAGGRGPRPAGARRRRRSGRRRARGRRARAAAVPRLPLRAGRPGTQRLPDRQGHRRGREVSRRHQPVRLAGRAHPDQPRPARPRAADAGRRLSRARWAHPARQPVARPGRHAAALAGRPAGCGGGEGSAAGERDRRDPRLDHRPGPHPPLSRKYPA